MRKLAYLLPALTALAFGACKSDVTPEESSLLAGEPGTCAGTVIAKNSEFCAGSCSPAVKCTNSESGNKVESCCVLVDASELDNSLSRSSEVDEYSGDGPPQLDCFAPGGYPTKIDSGTGDTRLVTVEGTLKAFSSGCDLKGVTVEIYKVQRTGNPETDGLPGELVGSAVTTSAESPAVEVYDDGCPTNNDTAINRRYEYAGVPMNTELMVLTHGSGWRELYTYNFFIAQGDTDLHLAAEPPDEGDVGTYTKDIRALKEGDFNLIPTVAIGTPISGGNGALGGEIHDCDNVRLQNAFVDTNGSRRAMIYFNDSEENPMPENGRRQTGSTSVFAALDVLPGFQRLTATGLIHQDEMTVPVTLGYYDVRVFPDSVTSVTLKGLQPHQVP